jgi:hypothetical protein
MLPMNGPPAARPNASRAGGRGLEVCDAAGDFVRRVGADVAQTSLTLTPVLLASSKWGDDGWPP